MIAYGKLMVDGCNLILNGVIDPCELGHLRELFGRVMADGTAKVLVDMSQVTEICPEGVSFLATVYETISGRGGSFMVTRASGPVKRALEATNLSQLISQPNPYGDNLIVQLPPMN